MKQSRFPFSFANAAGLRVQVNANGSLRRLDHHDILVNTYIGNEVEGGPTNLYLRRHASEIEVMPLLGPRSVSTVAVDDDGLRLAGAWRGIEYTLRLHLDEHEARWFWQGHLRHTGPEAVRLDVVYAQDVSLAHYGAVRMNEYYVSQYVDFTPMQHGERGWVLGVRQNLAMGGRNPWVLIGSLRRAVAFATDALQLHGPMGRDGSLPRGLLASHLPSTRLQHEHSMAVLQDEAQLVAPGGTATFGFFGSFEPHHPVATSSSDLTHVDRLGRLPDRSPRSERGATIDVSASVFRHAPNLRCEELDEAELVARFGGEWRHVERDDTRLLSFFVGADTHVVLAAKERQVLRPHGHLLRSGDHRTPDEASLTSTVWMHGVFHSMVTQGHVNINRFLSTSRSYLGLHRSGGQRLFVELDGVWHLLDVPSAFAMSPLGCRWVYKHAAGVIEVRATASATRHELGLEVAVISGGACRWLLSHHVALDGDDGAEAVPVAFRREGRHIDVRASVDGDIRRRFPEGYFRLTFDGETPVEEVGGDELLFLDGATRGQPFLCVRAAPATRLSLRLRGHLVPEVPLATHEGDTDAARAAAFQQQLVGVSAWQVPPAGEAAGELHALLPWLAHDAMVHYLAPRGLEQFSGGGWGTRDVCQGPVEMLLALGAWEPVRDILVRVFRQQNPDGDWPQWFMFFERERNIRPAESHGDIVFWPVLALASYLQASEDASILDEVIPFFDAQGDATAETADLWAHVERARSLIERRVIPGTSLPAYGHGDWNDSLQPVDPAMSEGLCSAWTVTLCCQTLRTMATALDRIGRAADAGRWRARADAIRAELQHHLIVDGVIAGYADFRDANEVKYLLHPGDRSTGIRYSLLPMIHAILNDLLTPEQARQHLTLIREHLLGADGARLFDRPFTYRGGEQRQFQRAETSSHFGREIGIMYMHAHLRYAEAMAHMGEAEAFFLALRQMNPIAIDGVIPTARRRQANCYYSSSDAAFADRYQAVAEYERVRAGTIDFEGGWRVYSSGAGIALRLVHECLLGIRRRKSTIDIDPVMPKSLDGLAVTVDLYGMPLRLHYEVGAQGCGPTALRLNGADLPFERIPHLYRVGGVRVARASLASRLRASDNALRITLA